jgi:hypothetical protein
MNNETRKISTLLLTVFVIVSAFIPALSPLPTINKSDSDYSLFESFTNKLNPSSSTATSRWFNQLGDDFMSNFTSDYLTFLDTILYGALGVLLVMLLIGIIMAIVSRKSTGAFIRVVAVLNTLTYAALILLTFYQGNKLNNDTYGLIKIAPSIGAWVGLITSFVLIIISAYGSSKTPMTQFQNNQNVMYPPQNPYPQNPYPQNSYPQNPPAANTQQQPHFQAQSANGYNVSTRPDHTQSQEEMEIARLGNGYVSNVFGAGASNSTGVTLTDKRLYLSGKLFKGEFGRKLKKTTSTCTVDLQDIIGMEFKRQKTTGLLITAIIFSVFDLLLFFGIVSGSGANAFALLLIMMFFIAPIGIFIAYFSTGATLFVVNSRNGSIGFDVRFAGHRTVESFAGSIQTVKNTYNSQSRM